MNQLTDKSTIYGASTPHGRKTSHRFPILGISLVRILLDLVSQLYPTGRAFYMTKNSTTTAVHNAINRSFIRLVNDAKSIIDSTFPDNENFSADDCSLWEYRLGLVSNPDFGIVKRRASILRKMSRGRNIPARQSKNYIEYQLQIAGFDVYVHENRFFENGVWVYKTPKDITDVGMTTTEHNMAVQHGIGIEHGLSSPHLIANSFDKNELLSVDTESLWATFFIGDKVLGNYASIPAARIEEFRELVLTLKPAHLVAFTFISII